MSTPEITKKNATEELLSSLGKYRPEFQVPGFWAALDKNSSQWAATISVSDFWKEVKKRLPQWRTEYKQSTSADLLTSLDLQDFVAKPSDSVIDKILRSSAKKPLHEIVPEQGPPIPIISDIVRTRIKCNYIDGVEFLATKLESLSAELGLDPQRQRLGKIEGYFAQHINIQQEVIYSAAGIKQIAKITCEIQIASSMASQMWQTSHSLYETVRSEMDLPDNWQWKPDDPRFLSNQLGHMIHLADGLLVQLRDLKKLKKG